MAAQTTQDVAKIYPGPVLLLAGPGTGKTHQLARRVKFLIEEQNISPDNICVITFTGEAARNMRQRLSDDKIPEVYVPPQFQPENIRTMHSLGYRIIKDEYRKVGLRKGFSVVSDSIRRILLADCARILGYPGSDGDSAEECRRYGNCEESEGRKCLICRKYKELLRALNAIDYDDQIFLACSLLKDNPDLLTKWRNSSRHLLVDEYQDINQAQYEFISHLCGDQEDGLFVVADDDQSIYSWRGGSPTYTFRFDDHFGSHAKIAKLDECRRCPPHVLQAALSVVEKNNTSRLQKDGLHSIKEKECSKVAVFEVPSDKYEASAICTTIANIPFNQDALVLVPGHRFAAPIKREMRKRRIPYDCKTNVADSGMNSINDLIKWLRNEKDNFSLRLCLERIVNNPSLRIPFEKIIGIKQKRERTLSRIANLWPEVTSKKSTLFGSLQTAIGGHDDLNFIVDSLGEIKIEWEDGQDIPRFLETVGRIIRPWASVKSMSIEIEDWVEDAFAKNATGGEPVARVLTMEAAKGLGSDQVFIVGLNKRIFPPEGLEKEKLLEKQRLLYVSMTRAKKKLHMYCSRTREGKLSFQQAPDGKDYGVLEPSPFLAWLPSKNVELQEKWPRKKGGTITRRQKT